MTAHALHTETKSKLAFVSSYPRRHEDDGGQCFSEVVEGTLSYAGCQA